MPRASHDNTHGHGTYDYFPPIFLEAAFKSPTRNDDDKAYFPLPAFVNVEEEKAEEEETATRLDNVCNEKTFAIICAKSCQNCLIIIIRSCTRLYINIDSLISILLFIQTICRTFYSLV